ncbi:hypothetical protein CSB11_02420 [Candidatus Campbellbacteria bacterium]|nr:MAG: hypothetical protein CSB11_02420 [Candidatus Campbellbacteria bacterium]
MIQKIIIAILALFVLSTSVFSQSLNLKNFNDKNSGLISELSLDMFPKHPSSHQEVLFKLKSFYFNLNFSETVVYFNGKEYKKGVGLKEFKIKTGKPGERNLIQVVVRDPKGKIHTKKVEFTPENVGLVYEVVDPNVPFGYKGKSTVISNSKVNIFAFPDFVSKSGKRIDKKSLIYTWYKNGEVDNKASGFGKYKYEVERMPARPSDLYIDVLVTDVTKKKVAKNKIYFSPEFTDVQFYSLNQSLPFTFKNVVKNGVLKTSDKNTTVLVVPYFMDMSEDENLDYTWKINNKRYLHNPGDKRDRLVFLNDTNKKETILNIFFQLKNDYRILQTAHKNLKLILKSENQDEVLNQQYYNEERSKKNKNSGLGGFFGL